MKVLTMLENELVFEPKLILTDLSTDCGAYSWINMWNYQLDYLVAFYYNNSCFGCAKQFLTQQMEPSFL